MLTRREFIGSVAAAAAIPHSALRTPQSANLLILTTDQHRADCVGCYGNGIVKTPAIDRLAGEGVRFTRHYVQAPQCVPSRGSMLTGRYPHVHRAFTNRYRLPDREQTIARVLGGRGYLTASIGARPFAPNNATGGFERIFGDPEHEAALKKAGWTGAKVAEYEAKLKETFQAHPVPWGEELDSSSVTADLAVEFLRQSRGRPFFVQVNFHRPHHPFDPPRPYAGMYDSAEFPKPHRRASEFANKPPEHQRALEGTAGFDLRKMTDADLHRITSYYYGSITLTDKCIGRILDELDKLGLAGNTLVVFNSDHGEMLGDHGLLFKGGYMYDEVLHVPLVVRFPGTLPAGKLVEPFTQEIDQMPTLLALLGAPAPEGVQGRSLLPLMAGEKAKWDETVYAEFPATKMVRTRDWKLVYYAGRPYGELYDLRSDPHELDNLWNDAGRATAKQDMMARLANWLIASHDPLPPPVDAPEVR
jgi:arylsulfatase A-like enzyme